MPPCSRCHQGPPTLAPTRRYPNSDARRVRVTTGTRSGHRPPVEAKLHDVVPRRVALPRPDPPPLSLSFSLSAAPPTGCFQTAPETLVRAPSPTPLQTPLSSTVSHPTIFRARTSTYMSRALSSTIERNMFFSHADVTQLKSVLHPRLEGPVEKG
jgi:hypothetical protein